MLWFMVSMTTVWQLPVPTTAEKGSEESLRLCRLSSRDDSCGFIEFAFFVLHKEFAVSEGQVEPVFIQLL